MAIRGSVRQKVIMLSSAVELGGECQERKAWARENLVNDTRMTVVTASSR